MAYATRITLSTPSRAGESRTSASTQIYPACPLAARPAGASSLLLTWEDLLGRR